jgi:hypothetical protein
MSTTDYEARPNAARPRRGPASSPRPEQPNDHADELHHVLGLDCTLARLEPHLVRNASSANPPPGGRTGGVRT